MKTKKPFTRMDLRQLVVLPRFLEIILYPLIWVVNRWLLVSKVANNIFKKAEERGLKNCDFMAFASDYLGYEIVIYGRENLPKHGAAIVASNHPGGGDLCAIFKAMAMLGRPDLKILINPLVHFSFIQDMVIPIPKGDYARKREMSTRVDEAFENGNIFPIFPAGQDSRLIDGKIQDIAWKGTFVAQAIRHDAPIVPIYISGENSPFFYWIASMRKKCGITFNLEQFFLVRELYKARGSKVTVIIGTPISPSTFAVSQHDREATNAIAQSIRSYVYQLAQDPYAKFNY